eukprot:CAMPEP_0119412312 /NCGR_PEP_ID=MMETSP1335-20130426/4791_1 /TAXON_ID=259385 /ORGANISM="Chrysoculter rhomboideus, Strain RCC1486" /LENGTH=93 /DNA_ID=CAMNT_0007437035 /DNA_START=560 /DNA_END=841 /DNA_ORIENTATION=+
MASLRVNAAVTGQVPLAKCSPLHRTLLVCGANARSGQRHKGGVVRQVHPVRALTRLAWHASVAQPHCTAPQLQAGDMSTSPVSGCYSLTDGSR